MRKAIVRAAILSLALVFGHATAGLADELPKRRPGHWKLRTVSASVGMATIDACIGADDSIAAPSEGRSCLTPKVERAGDQVIVNVTCRSNLGEERISTLFTGDFQTWYRGITKMTFEPPTNGVANVGVTVDATFIGPDCPANASP
ncbi:MAG: DUF3617 family protein [Hyphomicrobium sp.]|jgi:hypothetical protein